MIVIEVGYDLGLSWVIGDWYGVGWLYVGIGLCGICIDGDCVGIECGGCGYEFLYGCRV